MYSTVLHSVELSRLVDMKESKSCGLYDKNEVTTHLHLVPRSKNEWSYTSIP
jgi:hypothetical protein